MQATGIWQTCNFLFVFVLFIVFIISNILRPIQFLPDKFWISRLSDGRQVKFNTFQSDFQKELEFWIRPIKKKKKNVKQRHFCVQQGPQFFVFKRMECIRTFLYICQSHIPAAIILFSFLIPEFNTMELVKKTKNVFSSRHACVYSTFLGDFLREWEGRSSFVFTMKLFRLFLFIFLSFHPIERLYPLICFFF